ncbi:MAG: hypothetical protein JWP81_3615 [Ferruginibacter sp.]|nr:hypothetical protein [Ferruginibacter sp.]
MEVDGLQEFILQKDKEVSHECTNKKIRKFLFVQICVIGGKKNVVSHECTNVYRIKLQPSSFVQICEIGGNKNL